MAWFDTYPHKVWVSVILKDNKIINYNISNQTFKEKYLVTSKGFGYEEIFFIANSDQEHNYIFEITAKEWLKQWKLHEEFKGINPFIESKSIDDDVYTLNEINVREKTIKGCKNYPNCNAFKLNIDSSYVICNNALTCYSEMKYIRTIKDILKKG